MTQRGSPGGWRPGPSRSWHRACRTALLGVAVARPWHSPPARRPTWSRLAHSPGFRAAVEDATWGTPEGLDRIKCPVTVLWGTRDLILPVTGAKGAERGCLRPRGAPTGPGSRPMFDDPEKSSALLEGTGSK